LDEISEGEGNEDFDTQISEEEGGDSEGDNNGFLIGGGSNQNQMSEPVDPEGIKSKIDDNSNLTTQVNLTTTKTTTDITNPSTTTTNTNINKTQENLAKAVDPNLSKKAAGNLLEKANLKNTTNTGAKPLSEIALSAEKGENGYFWPLLISFFVVGIIVLVATFGYFKYVQAKEDQAVEL
jgi:hypothetical protein